jgi:hypothetical protein
MAISLAVRRLPCMIPPFRVDFGGLHDAAKLNMSLLIPVFPMDTVVQNTTQQGRSQSHLKKDQTIVLQL